MIRTIDVETLIPKIKNLVIQTNQELSKDIIAALDTSAKQEQSPIAKKIFSLMKQNREAAIQNQLPLCQDTGVAVFFLTIGQDVHFINGGLQDAINQGVKEGYQAGFLRKSIVADPLFLRENTRDNTPAVIHEEIVTGNRCKITFLAKGGGSENMSQLRMLRVSDGIDGIIKFVMDVVRSAQGNPCPPVIVGIGIGGTFEKAALLSKKALLRPIGSRHSDPNFAKLEDDLLKKINQTGIGPQGLGGDSTALAVHIKEFPCHLASLPVAVNIECHVHRHASLIV